MEQAINNKVIKGVHNDNHPLYQPPNTMRNSKNGVIMDAGEGNYVWTTIEGTKFIFDLNLRDRIIGWCQFRKRFFLLLFNLEDDYVRFKEIKFTASGEKDQEITIWSGANTILNLSFDYPIRKMIGFYENQEIQRIYFTDNYNPPRVINVGYENPSNKYVDIDEKFIEFTPAIEGSWGRFRFLNLTGGGNLKAGTYFFAWRLYHKGYYTDWSYHSAPVKVNPGTVGSTPDSYQEFEGAAPDETVTKSIRFELSGLDTDYDSIQVAAFYSNDYDSAEPGNIFYDGNLSSETMQLVYYGNEVGGIITIADLNSTSVVIERCKDLDIIKQRAAVSNVKLREELPIGNKINVDVDIIKREVVLDTTGYPGNSWTAGNKALVAAPKGGTVYSPAGTVYAGIHYYNNGTTDAVIDYGGGSTRTLSPGEVLKTIDQGTVTSGQVIPTIALRKYRKAGTLPGGPFSGYEWKILPNHLNGEYLNFKSSVVANFITGYPGDEIIRLGIVFFDHAGIPFFARWLNNQNPEYGNGDIITPRRNEETGSEDLINGYGLTSTDGGYYYTQLNGVNLGFSISGIDITDFKDQISGFMIVRAPIVHRNIAMGLLAKTIEDADNNVYSIPGWRNYLSDAYHKPNWYNLYCPEDIFELTGFSIQPGDKVKPLLYLEPYGKAEEVENLYQGLGRQEIDDNLDDRRLYQKFCIPRTESAANPATNGELDKSHEILYYTRYNFGDGDIPADPRNEITVFKSITTGISAPGGNDQSFNSKKGIVILDTDDTGTNPVGHHNRSDSDPIAPLVSIYRENDNPYGGTGDSDLANTNYISVGHFQEINDDVLNDIFAGGRYIFNEIEIFGGDVFVSLFDINRWIPDEGFTEGSFGTKHTQSHSVIFPVESRVNIDMREGDHIAKNRSYHETDNPSGIRALEGYYKLPEYNYNDGYSTSNIGDFYLPLPYNYNEVSEFDTMIRWSPFKTNGEREDSFRKFLTNDYIILNSKFGSIINIRNKFSRLVYWQEDAVGTIPIQERALYQDAVGNPIQLGTGGIFERYDEMTDRVGNSHQFGLVESDLGFHWYDAKREMFLTLTDSFKFSQDSVVKGLNNFFENQIDPYIVDFDNPYSTFGCTGGYDPYYKVVFYTFKLPGEIYKTIGLDIRQNVFIGEFDMPAMIYMRDKNIMYSVPYQSNTVYAHSKGDILSVYGQNVTAELQLVLKAEDFSSVYFDHFIMNGNEEFFESIEIATDSISKEEVIQKDYNGTYRFTSRNYVYRNGRWFGTYPKNGRERIKNTYLIVTFKTSKALTNFVDLTSYLRKAY